MSREEQIASILRVAPKWVLVAFAARCGRRAEKLFRNCSYDESGLQTVTRVVALAENTAAGTDVKLPAGLLMAGYGQNASDANAVYRKALEEWKQAQGLSEGEVNRLAIITSAAKAVEGVAAVLINVAEGDMDRAVSNASRVAELVIESASRYPQPGVAARDTIHIATSHIENDLKSLQNFVSACRTAWNDDTGVPPSIFGTL